MVETVDCFRINTQKDKLGLSSYNNPARVLLHHHVCCALIELNVRVLQFAEHECLGKRENEGYYPGGNNHQPGLKQFLYRTEKYNKY